jgi:hypothetical protein
MANSSRSAFPFAKIVTLLASAFGIALGLCGLNLLLLQLGVDRGGHENYFGGPILGTLGLIEFGVMLISGPLIIITVIAWVISGLVKNRGGPQRLFDNSGSDPEKEDDRNKP